MTNLEKAASENSYMKTPSQNFIKGALYMNRVWLDAVSNTVDIINGYDRVVRILKIVRKQFDEEGTAQN